MHLIMKIIKVQLYLTSDFKYGETTRIKLGVVTN